MTVWGVWECLFCSGRCVLYVCERAVMDVVFYVCIVSHRAIGAYTIFAHIIMHVDILKYLINVAYKLLQNT